MGRDTGAVARCREGNWDPLAFHFNLGIWIQPFNPGAVSLVAPVARGFET